MIGAKTTLRGTVKVNNDGVGLTPSIGQFSSLPVFDPKFL
jgi:hypothetical protein